ncbi:MAG: guanine deaminase [Burkholderiales bacterium]|nr:MAG: guanine deaminase [Burkholderiales bacterium]
MRLLRGTLLGFERDPGAEPDRGAITWIEDGALAIGDDGRIVEARAWRNEDRHRSGLEIVDWRDRLIMPGFVDAHVHYPQLDVAAAWARGLLDWLERQTFPAEAAFADAGHANEVAGAFLDALLRHGTTSAGVWATVHPASVDAFFEQAAARDMRMVCGKVLMDRNCPAGLRETADRAERASLALIERWHGRGRLGYAVTPRFAPTSSPGLLDVAARLMTVREGLVLQTHVAESRDEVAWVAELFPDSRSYLDVYERAGLLGPRSILAHGLWLDAVDRERLAALGASLAFCPSSNLVLGSGLLDLDAATRAGLAVALATDVGGGPSLSMLRALHDAHQVLALQGQHLDPWRGFYLATLAGARALGIDRQVGRLAPGCEADLVVLDWAVTPEQRRQQARGKDATARLFTLMMTGDDRNVAATYVMGAQRWRRPEPGRPGRSRRGPASRGRRSHMP